MEQNGELGNNSKQEIDTDSLESRTKRAENHYNFQQEIETTFGKPFKERYLQIRSKAFSGFDSVWGEDVHGLIQKGEIISNERAEKRDSFAPSTEYAQKVIGPYIEQMDELYGEIKKLPTGSEKEETVFRFLAVMFDEGIMIHPAADGNGQTFKMLAESYLKELLPEYRDKFIPIKYPNQKYDQKYDMAISFIGGGWISEADDLSAGPVAPIEARNNRDKKLVELLKNVRDAGHGIWSSEEFANKNSEEINDEINRRMLGVINQAAKEINMPELGKLNFKYETQGKMWWKKQRMMNGSAENTLRDFVYQFLINEGYEPLRANVTAYTKSGEKIERMSYAISQLIVNKEGQKYINEYVLRGKVEIPDEETIPNNLYRKAIKIFDRQKKKIFDVIETKEDHDRRHIELMAA